MHQSVLLLSWQPCTHFCDRPCTHVRSSMTVDTLGTGMEPSSTGSRRATRSDGAADAGDDFGTSDGAASVGCSEACAGAADPCDDCNRGLRRRGLP